MEAIHKFERAQTCFLNDVFRIAVVPREPARQIIGSVQMHRENLFKSFAPVLFVQALTPRILLPV
jgi:hypothetical protein